MIHIDASRYSITEKRTGVENYSYFLINELARRHPEQITLVSPRRIDLPLPQIVLPSPRLWTHARLSAHVLARRLPNLFVPSHVLPLVCPKKSAITIHDVAFRRFPESYSISSRSYLDWAARFAAKKAAVILVPSQATQADLMEFYNIPEARIHVTPLGVVPLRKPPEEESRKILGKWSLAAGNYFLYIGRLEHKKNTDTLLKAFARFSQRHPGIPLVLGGFPGHGGEGILAHAPEAAKKSLILTGYLAGPEKEALLAHALAFVFPSRYEGFGLPILEAMQHGLPIIASDIPSSREILGDHGFFFETESADQLAERMEELLRNPEKARVSIQAYPEILRNYSWEKCADKTWDALQQMC